MTIILVTSTALRDMEITTPPLKGLIPAQAQAGTKQLKGLVILCSRMVQIKMAIAGTAQLLLMEIPQ